MILKFVQMLTQVYHQARVLFNGFSLKFFASFEDVLKCFKINLQLVTMKLFKFIGSNNFLNLLKVVFILVLFLTEINNKNLTYGNVAFV